MTPNPSNVIPSGKGEAVGAEGCADYRVEPYSDGFGNYHRIVGGKFDGAPNIVYCFTRDDALRVIEQERKQDRIDALIAAGQCPGCDGSGVIASRVTVYEHGCGFPHSDSDEQPCPLCRATGGAP